MILNFQWKLLNENTGKRNQLICRKLKLLIIKNFQSNLGIQTIKQTWWNTFSKNGEKHFPNVLTSSQTNYLANLDGATDYEASQSSERIGFYCDYEETDTKIVAHIKFLCDNIHLSRVIVVSPDSDVAVISLYQSVINLTFLDALWFRTGTDDDQRYIPIHVLVSELGLPICCLLSSMHAGCHSVSSFSHRGDTHMTSTLRGVDGRGKAKIRCYRM